MTQTIQCLVAIKNFGATVYASVCDGSAVTVPWGFMEWVKGILVIMGCVILLAVLLIAVFSFLSMFKKVPKAPGMQE